MATWTNGTAGRLVGGTHWIRGIDVIELAEAVNRRRRLVYLSADDFSGAAGVGLPVTAELIANSLAGTFTSFRHNISARLVPGTTPDAKEWLWPVADGDGGKKIVNGSQGVEEDEVSLFEKLNGTTTWTDWSIGGSVRVRAVHLNELRWCMEHLTRGRWKRSVQARAGITSLVPGSPWLQRAIYNDGTDELHYLGSSTLRVETDAPPQRGLVDVTVRTSSQMVITASADCTVGVHRCCRAVDYTSDPTTYPNWTSYAPGASWASPGGLGAGDAVTIGSVACTADVPATLSGASLATALQAMIDGAPQNFLLRRADEGFETIDVSAEVLITFDLAVPPN